MNNTKSSRLSQYSRKPEAMRVVLRSRNGSKDRPRPATESTSLLLLDQSRVSSTLARQKSTIRDMKDYVRNRMKTDYDQSNAKKQKYESHPQIQDSPVKGMDMNRNWSGSRSQLALSRTIKPQGETDRISQGSKVKFLTIADLQEKTKSLLQSRLKQCNQNKIQRSATIEDELQTLVSDIKKCKIQTQPQQVDADISHLDRKIKLIQRFMAESVTESDIIKRKYLGKECGLTQGKGLNARLPVPNHELSVLRKDYRKIMRPVIASSLNRGAFVRPDSTAYDIYKYRNVFFNADRHKQPLPRSSYGREYLIYAVGGQKAILPKENEFLRGARPEFRSSYQSDFMAKHVESANIKELDSYRNKNLQMRFGRPDKKGMAYSQEYYRQGLTRYKPKQYPLQQSKLTMLSESRREYQQTKHPMRSSIKHKHLHELIHEYKSQMMKV